MIDKRIYACTGAALLLYVFFAVLRIRSFLKTHVTSAPVWMNYIGLTLECVLIIALLIVFAEKLPEKAAETALTGGMKSLRIVGLIVIAAGGIVIGSKGAADTASASKLPYILASLFHTLLYAGVWELFTEMLRLRGQK